MKTTTGITFKPLREKGKISWVITSPPYYGMRTYLQDQWLRNWFLGGPQYVDYTNEGQLAHSSKQDFVQQLCKVWQNAAEICKPDCHMVVRFGAINDRKIDPVRLIKDSFAETPWHIVTLKKAGSAHKGRRQAEHFRLENSKAIEEFDVWARLES